ncbi:MAG: magnesium transporter [Promethearchaeota archaeon]
MVLSVCALGEMLTGTFLESGITYLPGLLILIPAILQMRGIISGSFTSRISTALHIGTIKPQFKSNTKIFYQNIYAILFLSLFTPVLAAFLSSLISEILHVNNIGFLAYLFIAIVAGLISGFIQLFISIASGIIIFNRGLDPDIIVFPLLSVIGDILSVFSLVFACNLFISMQGWDYLLVGWWEGIF